MCIATPGHERPNTHVDGRLCLCECGGVAFPLASELLRRKCAQLIARKPVVCGKAALKPNAISLPVRRERQSAAAMLAQEQHRAAGERRLSVERWEVVHSERAALTRPRAAILYCWAEQLRTKARRGAWIPWDGPISLEIAEVEQELAQVFRRRLERAASASVDCECARRCRARYVLEADRVHQPP